MSAGQSVRGGPLTAGLRSAGWRDAAATPPPGVTEDLVAGVRAVCALLQGRGDVDRWALVLEDGDVIAAGMAEADVLVAAPVVEVPLRDAEGRVLGCLRGWSRTCRALPTGRTGAVRDAAAALLALLQQQRRLEQARAEADTDPLTGLRNRRGWLGALTLEQNRRALTGAAAAVAVVDLDGFKAINDRRGHAAGDRVLRRASDVLVRAVRDTDVVARVGGDEFAVLQPATTSDSGPDAGCLDRVRIGLRSAGLTASVAHVTRRRGENLLATWHRADLAMYQVKAARRMTDTA